MQHTDSRNAPDVRYFAQDMEDADAEADQDATAQPRASQPEEELYSMFLLCQFLCDQKEWSKVLLPAWPDLSLMKPGACALHTACHSPA